MTPPTLTPLESHGRRGRLLSIEPLTPESFAPFGTAISSPFPDTLNNVPAKVPEPLHSPHQPTAVFANQNSALKTSPVSKFVDNYPVRSSSSPADGAAARSRPQMSMFSCFPRNLSGVGMIDTSSSSSTTTSSRPGQKKRQQLAFEVSVLERHPYTTQTFSPLGLSSEASRGQSTPTTVFLVIVAPSLSSSSASAKSETGQDVEIQNPPDLSRLRAFVATGGQAVTYGPGTWHAPMAVIGRRRVDFVVTQFVNGVADDDCQEVLLGDNAVGVDLGALDLDLQASDHTRAML
ncbi:hypothetical protein LTS17_005645 [Exophiala oligosperma]